MEIRFSYDGPAFPAELLEEFIKGDVVFLSGAGVGAPQMPSFEGLWRKTCSALNLAPTPGEMAAIRAMRMEEAFGALERRLARPASMVETVTRELRPAIPALENHIVLLRLARDQNNEICLVTTNFDSLFELALDVIETPGAGARASHAAPSLPAPGGPKFSGIIHLHGRIANEEMGLEETSLVLTSASYGDAYMRSGWASRFLFELLRCKTLVLIGYSAGDAPVRYFLNVLAADRERFADIRKVYAFDGHDGNPARAEERWTALDVTPLPYDKTSRANHRALWDDLEQLANFVDNPSEIRRNRAIQLLGSPYDAGDSIALTTIKWLYQGKRDLLNVIVSAVEDPRWFEFFSAERLVSLEDFIGVFTDWCARDWTSRVRLNAAVEWTPKLGHEFGIQLLRQLSITQVPPLFRNAWRIVAASTQKRTVPGSERQPLSTRIKCGNFDDSDLRAAVNLLRPHIEISRRTIQGDVTHDASNRQDSPQRMSDLLSLELRAGMGHDARQLREMMCALTEHHVRILEIATAALRDSMMDAQDAQLLSSSWDRIDFSVPAVEQHEQNQHRRGAVELVVLLSSILAEVAKGKRCVALRFVTEWGHIPGNLGRRLILHAMRNELLFSSDQVARELLNLSYEEFWNNHREVVQLLTERLAFTEPGLIRHLCDRIILEGPSLFDDVTIHGLGTSDWRASARARSIWLRLEAINSAGVLPVTGMALLVQIHENFPFTRRKLEDRDLFQSYSTGVQWVAGKADEIIKVAPGDRVTIALEQQSARDPSVQRNWSAYCGSDPEGALTALRSSPVNEETVPLWTDLIGSVAWSQHVTSPINESQRESLAAAIFASLEAVNDEIIGALTSFLADLWPNSPDLVWWDRIWAAFERDISTEDYVFDSAERIMDNSLNVGSGRMASHLLKCLGDAFEAKRRTQLASLKTRLRNSMESDTAAGFAARTVYVRESSFIVTVDYAGAGRRLKQWLNAESAQGSALRVVLVEMANLSHGRNASKLYKKAILLGAKESRCSGSAASNIAGNLLIPLIMSPTTTKATWPISSDDVALALQHGSPQLREAVAEQLQRWTATLDKNDPERVWRDIIAPLFKQIWPKDKSYKAADCTPSLAGICIAARAEFPNALKVIKDHMLPIHEGVDLTFLMGSEVAEQFPVDTLELLWRMFGADAEGTPLQLKAILGRIKAAKPQLSNHRQLQRLAQSVQ